ncbi:MAG: tRNA (adenosine(37)-N6)-threonylcarbamoyltransferase complex ATPase subunit type 1 TsaE [Bacteroidetes bacterium]|nr:tRNA (adenosine(37)-N6)-threonylcarbamoyltransferase complex ATPase subunit type 1 TsaE [Bacteroidota bacterium]
MQESVNCSRDQLEIVAQKLLEKYPSDRIFAFYGGMGAGKTTFIKAICNQLFVGDVVNSPTFAIVNEYLLKDGGSVFHFDLYRLKSWQEMLDIGYEDYFYSGNHCLLEWPEKIENLLPESTIRVKIELTEETDRRIITF